MIGNRSTIPGGPTSDESQWFVADGSSYAGVIPEDWHFSAILAVHIAMSIALCLFGLTLYRRGERRPLLFFSILSFVAFGPFGLAGSALAAFLQILFARRAQPFAQWYASLFPQHSIKQLQTLHDLLAMRQAGLSDSKSVVSLFDILEAGTVSQKQAALTLIVDHFKPEFAPVLRSALSDPEPVIRVLGATAVARLETEFATRWTSLSHRLALHPKDPALNFAAAEHLAAYAESGLLDTARATDMWKNALTLVQKAAALDKADSRFAVLASRILLRLGRPEEALSLLRPKIAHDNPPCDVLIGIVESLFSLDRFDELRQVCRQHQPRLMAESLPVKVRAAVNLWGADHGVRQW